MENGGQNIFDSQFGQSDNEKIREIRDVIRMEIRRTSLRDKFRAKRMLYHTKNDIEELEGKDRTFVEMREKFKYLKQRFLGMMESNDKDENIQECLDKMNQEIVYLYNLDDALEVGSILEQMLDVHFVQGLNKILREFKGSVVGSACQLGGNICTANENKIIQLFSDARCDKAIVEAVRRDDIGDVELLKNALHFLTNLLFFNNELIKVFFNGGEFNKIKGFIKRHLKSKPCSTPIVHFLESLCSLSNINLYAKLDEGYFHLLFHKFAMRESETTISSSLRVLSIMVESSWSSENEDKHQELLNYLIKNKFFESLVVLLKDEKVSDTLKIQAISCFTAAFLSNSNDLNKKILEIPGFYEFIKKCIHYPCSQLLKKDCLVVLQNIVASQSEEINGIVLSDHLLLDQIFSLCHEHSNTMIGKNCLRIVYNLFQSEVDDHLYGYIQGKERSLLEFLVTLLKEVMSTMDQTFILNIIQIFIVDLEETRKEMVGDSEAEGETYLEYLNECSGISETLAKIEQKYKNKEGDIEKLIFKSANEILDMLEGNKFEDVHKGDDLFDLSQREKKGFFD